MVNINLNHNRFTPRLPTDDEIALSKHIKMCYLKGCGRQGNWTPVLVLSPDGKRCMFQNFGNMQICDYHKNNIGLSDLIDGKYTTGSAFEAIRQAFINVGKVPPEREFAKLIWRAA